MQKWADLSENEWVDMEYPYGMDDLGKAIKAGEYKIEVKRDVDNNESKFIVLMKHAPTRLSYSQVMTLADIADERFLKMVLYTMHYILQTKVKEDDLK